MRSIFEPWSLVCTGTKRQEKKKSAEAGHELLQPGQTQDLGVESEGSVKSGHGIPKQTTKAKGPEILPLPGPSSSSSQGQPPPPRPPVFQEPPAGVNIREEEGVTSSTANSSESPQTEH